MLPGGGSWRAPQHTHSGAPVHRNWPRLQMHCRPWLGAAAAARCRGKHGRNSSSPGSRCGKAEGDECGQHRHNAAHAGCHDRQGVDLRQGGSSRHSVLIGGVACCLQACTTAADGVSPSTQHRQMSQAGPQRRPPPPAPTRLTLAARLPGPPGRQPGKRWVQALTTAQTDPAMAMALRVGRGD